MTLTRLSAPRRWGRSTASSEHGSWMNEESCPYHQVSPCDLNFHCDFHLEISTGGLEWHSRAQASDPSEEGCILASISSSDLTSLSLSFPLGKMRIGQLSCAALGTCALESECPTLLFTSCTPLSKFLNLAVPPFPHLSK